MKFQEMCKQAHTHCVEKWGWEALPILDQIYFDFRKDMPRMGGRAHDSPRYAGGPYTITISYPWYVRWKEKYGNERAIAELFRVVVHELGHTSLQFRKVKDVGHCDEFYRLLEKAGYPAVNRFFQTDVSPATMPPTKGK